MAITRHACQCGNAAKALRGLAAIHHGHGEVHHDQVGVRRTGNFKAFRAIFGRDQPKPQHAQRVDRHLAVLLRIVDDEHGLAHWGDETGLRSDDVRGRSYAPQGQTPVVRVKNKRHGLSVISTVTNKGTMRWKIFDGALNSDILI
jgi:hypothetical protein